VEKSQLFELYCFEISIIVLILQSHLGHQERGV
jgi:hypothetical protein